MIAQDLVHEEAFSQRISRATITGGRIKISRIIGFAGSSLHNWRLFRPLLAII
jgi:hypothetical protein